MIETGSQLDTRWHFARPPATRTLGALGVVRDETQIERAVMIVSLDASGPRIEAPCTDAAAAASPLLDVAATRFVVDGLAIELLSSRDRVDADAFHARHGATLGARQRAAAIARDASSLAEELAAMHARGVVHGAIARWMLVAREESPHLVLAGFTVARSEGRRPGVASDDVRALDAAVHALVEANVDDVSVRQGFPRVGEQSLLAWSEALHAFAASHAPYRDGPARGPLFPREAYRDDPIELPTGRGGSDHPGLFSEMTPRDWRILARVGGGVIALGVLIIGGTMRTGPREVPSTARSPAVVLPTERRARDQCRGEPIRPVRVSRIPSSATRPDALTAVCAGGAMYAVVDAEHELFVATRGSTPGMTWQHAVEVTNTASVVSDAMLGPSGPVAAWIERDGEHLGYVDLDSPSSRHVLRIENAASITRLMALGATDNHAFFVASWQRGHASSMHLLRVPARATAVQRTVTSWRVDGMQPWAVWSRGEHPIVLVQDTASRALRALEIDPAELNDAGDELPATAVHERGRTDAPAYVSSAAGHAFAADLGNGNYGAVRYVVAFATEQRARIVTLEGDRLTLGEGFESTGSTFALTPRIGGADLVAEDSGFAWFRRTIRNDGSVDQEVRGTLPRGAPGADRFAAVSCGDEPWIVFAGSGATGLELTALPAVCDRPDE